MCGWRYFVRQARLGRSSHYSEIKMRSVLLNQFLDSFENEGGDFAFWFEGTATKLTILWRDVIHASKTVMIFGAPFSQGRSFAELFRKKKPQHAHHIFRLFSSEYYGDTGVCAMLLIALPTSKVGCRRCLVGYARGCRHTSMSYFVQSFNESSFNTNEVRRFQYFFDHYCEYAFVNCMNHYNDYSQLLIIPDDFMNYLELSKTIFPQQWSFLRATCGFQARDDDDHQDYIEQQIFMVLLNLQRLVNFRALKHWAMVISTAYYGWGTSASTPRSHTQAASRRACARCRWFARLGGQNERHQKIERGGLPWP